jgi:predicted RNA-binding Zn ribbon-like protein
MCQQAFRLLHSGGEELNSNPAAIAHEFDFIGGNLCLDFANTVGGLPADSPSQDRLLSYAHLVAWSQQANLMSEGEGQVLLNQAKHDPAEAAGVLERAHVLREAVYGIFAALALNTTLTEHDFEVLNKELEQGTAGARVVVIPDGFGWEWRKAAGSLDQMLAPIARSAATLLTTTAERQLVRQCANEQCRWLFVDTTKNHRRRWCKTTGCGNVMRVRKHRERQQGQESSA